MVIMAAARRFAWVVFVLFAVLATVFGVFPGGWFEPGADRDTTLLISTYAAVAVVLTTAIAATSFRRGERWAWFAFWIWPLFFTVHGVAFFAVDYVFAALGVAALALTAPLSRRAAPGAPREP